MATEPKGPQQDIEFLWKRRKYLMLLATLVAGVTYAAGLNPPGGVRSQEGGAGAVPPSPAVCPDRVGDPVLVSTYSRRYTAFFYCNAAAFVASLVVIMFLLDRRIGGNRVGLTVLRSAMLLDLLALMAAFAAGICRDVVASIYVSALFALVFAYICRHPGPPGNHVPLPRGGGAEAEPQPPQGQGAAQLPAAAGHLRDGSDVRRGAGAAGGLLEQDLARAPRRRPAAARRPLQDLLQRLLLRQRHLLRGVARHHHTAHEQHAERPPRRLARPASVSPGGAARPHGRLRRRPAAAGGSRPRCTSSPSSARCSCTSCCRASSLRTPWAHSRNGGKPSARY